MTTFTEFKGPMEKEGGVLMLLRPRSHLKQAARLQHWLTLLLCRIVALLDKIQLNMMVTRLLLSIAAAGCGVWAQDQKVNGDIQSIPVGRP